MHWDAFYNKMARSVPRLCAVLHISIPNNGSRYNKNQQASHNVLQQQQKKYRKVNKKKGYTKTETQIHPHINVWIISNGNEGDDGPNHECIKRICQQLFFFSGAFLCHCPFVITFILIIIILLPTLLFNLFINNNLATISFTQWRSWVSVYFLWRIGGFFISKHVTELSHGSNIFLSKNSHI